MNTLLPRVAIWLIPERQVRARLQEQIHALAERFGGISFVPHVTLYSCYRSPQQTETLMVSRLAREASEISLQVEALSGTGKLTQALTINFTENPELACLYRRLKEGLPGSSSYILKPHLSLLYQQLEAQFREALLEELTLDVDRICFDEIRAVAIPEELKSLDDLQGWQTLLSCRLASRPNVDTL